MSWGENIYQNSNKHFVTRQTFEKFSPKSVFLKKQAKSKCEMWNQIRNSGSRNSDYVVLIL